ncbi:hypothetical protein KCU88_g129, partial [Aureobasidium melanogenum]
MNVRTQRRPVKQNAPTGLITQAPRDPVLHKQPVLFAFVPLLADIVRASSLELLFLARWSKVSLDGFLYIPLLLDLEFGHDGDVVTGELYDSDGPGSGSGSSSASEKRKTCLLVAGGYLVLTSLYAGSQ